MPRLGQTLVATAIAALLAAPIAAGADDERGREALPAAPSLSYSPDRVIVEWAADASAVERRSAREEAGVDFTDDLGSRRFQLVETEPGQAPRQAIRELEADPAVHFAVRDGYDGLASVPNDPFFNQLWGLRNTGLGVGGFLGAVAGDDIDVLGAWEATVGTPTTVVADIDGGYRFEHPDLANVAWSNPGETLDGIDNDSNGIVDDVHGADFIGSNAEAPQTDGDPTDDDLVLGGHGVHTAGTIGAEGNNGIGITGVAQDVRIMPLRVCSAFVLAEEHGCLFSAEIAAINYAGANGARAANMSLGGNNFNAAVRDALAANPQTLFVIAAGNDARSNDVIPQYPCSYDPLGEGKSAVDNVVCVAATDQADHLASFSNWGAQSVDLGAPGTETLSTYPYSYPLKDDFQVDDFAAKWSASGADGGFGRTSEAPLTSYGISDSPGATPVADSERASTATVNLTPGHESCALELDRWVSGINPLWVEVELGEEVVHGIGIKGSGRRSIDLTDKLSEGGEVIVRFRYEARSSPAPSDGAWVDDVELHCMAKVGEAVGYEYLQGTSMATPHVTGTAALLFSLKPSASVSEVRQALLSSVDPIPSLAGKTTSGGRLDAGAAVDLLDTVAPAAPNLSTTVPASPSQNNQPRLRGSAQRGTSVDVYANANCSGAPVATGTAAQLAATGIAVSVTSNTVTQLSARATDLAPLTSACSAPISYTHGSAVVPPPTDPGGGTDPGGTGSAGSPPAASGNPAPAPAAGPPAPVCTVPKLTGKTLSQAKAALKSASCELGVVRKPRPHRGKQPPLVVRSSSPAAGAHPASGRVALTLGPKPRKGHR